MNMDRSQKNLEKKKDDRTIEYLELKYDNEREEADLVYVFKTGVPESAFLFLSIFMCGKCFVSI